MAQSSSTKKTIAHFESIRQNGKERRTFFDEKTIITLLRSKVTLEVHSPLKAAIEEISFIVNKRKKKG